jgi:hypothetical protein
MLKHLQVLLFMATSLLFLAPLTQAAGNPAAETVVKNLYTRPGIAPGIRELKIAALRSGVPMAQLIGEMSRQLSDSYRGKNLKHAYDLDSDYNPLQLQMGIEIEKEHTDDPEIAKIIAKAHLAEMPDYYNHLIKMEAQVQALKKLNQKSLSRNFR